MDTQYIFNVPDDVQNDEIEIWRPIIFSNIRNIYEISSRGNIRNRNTQRSITKNWLYVKLLVENNQRRTFNVEFIMLDAFKEFLNPIPEENITLCPHHLNPNVIDDRYNHISNLIAYRQIEL